MKAIATIIAVSVCMLSAQCCSANKETVKETAVESKKAEVSLTIKELAAYNGKNGKPAYVAVDGVIYDVTGVDAWKDGEHKGGKAGTDISELIKNAPHKISVLGKRTTVGKLAAETPKKTK